MKYRNVREILMNFIPMAAFFLALLIGAIMIAILGVNPLVAYQALLKGAFGSMNAVADTIVKATPLLFVGLGICIAFRAGVLNILVSFTASRAWSFLYSRRTNERWYDTKIYRRGKPDS